jgi:prohead serine protease
VVLAVEHAPPFLARTARPGFPATLDLEEDARGLTVDAELDASDPDVQSLVSKVRRGVLSEMSFSFRVPPNGETWNSDRSERTVRQVDMAGGDVSVVRSGANSSTSVSVRGRAAGAFEVRTAGGLIAVVERRQMVPDVEPDRDEVVCVHCTGRGRLGDGSVCPVCGGSGMVEPDDDGDEDGRSARAKYSAAELAAMLKKGHALANAAGQPSFPIEDADDLRRAIRAVGRSSRDPNRVRMHILKRAKALGLMSLIPDTWASDGSLKRSALVENDCDELRMLLHFREQRYEELQLARGRR